MADSSPEQERQETLATLARLDPNGTWSDSDSIADGMDPLTLAEARAALAKLRAN